MRILITNDDGVRAPGLIALTRAVMDLGEVVVVAPQAQQSAVGHSITLHKPLRCFPLTDFAVDGVAAFHTNGTPTDAVLLGMNAVMKEKPDIVLSGINGGPNLGADVTYSGTVAGAMEGAVAGIPSIAASMGSFDNLRYDECARFVRYLAKAVVDGRVGGEMLLNVNYPNIPLEEIKGIAITRLGLRWYDDVVHERVDPRGAKYYWISGKKVLHGRDPGTDAFELEQGCISITPLTLDLTRHDIREKLSSILMDSDEAAPHGLGLRPEAEPVSGK
jgi:5'-nucleotidase